MSYLDGRAPLKIISSYGHLDSDRELYANKKWVGKLGPGSQKPLLEKNLTWDLTTQVHEIVKTPTREGSYPSNIIGNMLFFNDDQTKHYKEIQANITGRNAEYDHSPFIEYGGTFMGSQYMYGGLSNAFEFVNGKYKPKVLHMHSMSLPERGGARADHLVKLGLLPPITHRPWYDFGPY
jgi:hypothetical protein